MSATPTEDQVQDVKADAIEEAGTDSTAAVASVEEAFEVGGALVGGVQRVSRGSKKIEAKNSIDDHDEQQQSKHVQNGGKALEHLPEEPPDPPAEVSVNHKQHPQ